MFRSVCTAIPSSSLPANTLIGSCGNDISYNSSCSLSCSEGYKLIGELYQCVKNPDGKLSLQGSQQCSSIIDTSKELEVNPIISSSSSTGIPIPDYSSSSTGSAEEPVKYSGWSERTWLIIWCCEVGLLIFGLYRCKRWILSEQGRQNSYGFQQVQAQELATV